MASPPTVTLTLLLRQMDLRRLVWLVILMVASAVTEGISLVLLVPMLAVLGGNFAGAGRIGAWIASTGLPLALGPLLTLFTALVVLRAVINNARNYSSQQFEMRVVDRLRERAWKALLNCDWRVYSAMRQTDNTSLLITNIDRVGSAIGNILALLALGLTLIGGGAAAFAISPKMALAAAAGVALALLAYRNMQHRASALGGQLGAAYRAIHAHMGEGLRALRVIKSLGLESDVAGRGLASFGNLRQAQLGFLRAQGNSQMLLQTIGAVVLAGAVWLAMTKAGAGITEIIPLVALFSRGLPLLGSLQDAWENWAYCKPSLQATFDLINRAEAAREPDPDDVEPPALARELAFEGVTVRFAETAPPALDAATLRIAAGSIVALIGPSGAGKSTIADLLGGLLAPDAGVITVDGVILDSGLRRAWRKRVAYVQQETLLLDGTIRDNLVRANPAADEPRIRQALADASAQFVDLLPRGIDTVIGDGGRRLSGGEQQRIALARALMRDPALLILDEATSALDPENEAAIAQAVAGLRQRLTILIIGHRGLLTELADRTVLLDSGRIVTIRDNAAG